ncbi:hypothetical protein H257_01250 [Aphanomyces astaci]|uniref:Uncharacterized protein n=1 Tax=Aphanomyces astaci TaxID=112090 RepID=W4H8A0_APHAT|nr:hypothetical protein H257_01250 [Aphanomyces astaci]ETV87796.1 hypothetical protein H257_01250 [Aphanomyces astaci]|eukprot:XP_009822659.1 hypothetical protein H257_01250 [Aphanomyces astaci]
MPLPLVASMARSDDVNNYRSYYWSSLLLSRREDWGDEVNIVEFVHLTDPEPSYCPSFNVSAALATPFRSHR